jgi:hypothetical protein
LIFVVLFKWSRFGFDNDQKEGRLKRLINHNDWYKGIKTYQKGDVGNVKAHALWKGKMIK